MKLEFKRQHARDLPALKALAQARLEHYDARHPHLSLLEHFRWVSERVASGSYKGGTGTVTLDEREVRVDLVVPFFARPFRGRIEDFVRRELELALSET